MPHLPDHQTDHDPLLIAAFAAGDAGGADLERAQALVAACDDCAALHHDLRAIAAAMPAVPAPARSRDFRLSREQADALRPSRWSRLLAPLAGPRFAFAGPLGGSLAALGLVGILVAGAASSPIAGSGAARERVAGTADGAAPVTTEVQHAAASDAAAQPPQRPQPSAAAVAPDAGVAGDGGAAASTPPVDTNVQAPPSDRAPVLAANAGSSPGAYEGTKSAPDASAPALVAPRAAPLAAAPPMASPFLVGAAVLLVVGVLLAAGRLAARRAA